MRYIILILIVICSSCDNKNGRKADQNTEYLRHVGDIPFDSKVDDQNFKPCHEDMAFVHYNFGNSDLYEGEKPAIVRTFMNINLPKIEGSSGYITVRFMVNCEGKTGRFRVEQLDFSYKEKKFNAAIVNAILSATKSLNGWIPATYKDKVYDYYKYLTFKIIDNQITDILP